MKALVKNRAERGLWIDNVPEPSIGINDVLIRVQMAGICGTDLHICWTIGQSATVQVHSDCAANLSARLWMWARTSPIFALE